MVYGWSQLPARINETLLLIEMVAQPTTRFAVYNDVLLYNSDGNIRIAVLDRMADINHAESILNVGEGKTDCFCLMSEGRLAIVTSGLLRAVRICDGEELWSLPCTAVGMSASASVITMEYCNESLYIMDNESNCIRLPIPAAD